MRIYWSAKQVPELAHLSSSQRKNVLRECHFRDGTLLFLFCLLLWSFGGLANWFTHRLSLRIWGSLLCFAIAGAVAGQIVCWIQLMRIRPRIRQYVEQHGEELKTI